MSRKGGVPPEQRGQPFSKDYQPNNHGRPKGSRDRRTIVLEALLTRDKDGEFLVDKATMSVLRKAIKNGDAYSLDKLLDSGFGKVVDEQKLTLTSPVQIQRIKDDAFHHPDADATLPGEPEPSGS